jgi:hypothetical protein
VIDLVEKKIERALRIRKINVWVAISSIASLCVALLFLISDNLYFRTLFLLPIAGGIYYYYRYKTYRKDIEYLPKFLYAYSRLKEKEDLEDDSPIQSTKTKTKIVYKYKDKIVYRDKIKKVPVEKVVIKKVPVEKVVEKVKVVEKEVPVEKIVEKKVPVEKIVYRTKESKPKKGYVRKKNIYKDNDIVKDIEQMLANQFYNIPLQERARRIYSLINQKNVDRKIQYEYEKEKEKEKGS